MPNNCLQAAMDYAGRGLSVIPVRGEDKKPFISWEEYQKRRATPEEIRTWWAKYPKAMIGIVCGEISGIFVIDCDNTEAYERIQKALPDSFLCPIAKTPRGWHLWFLFALNYKVANRPRVLPGVDIRTTGGYIIAPPSTNAEGKGYAWQEGLTLGEVELATVPDALMNYPAASYGVSKHL